MCDQRSSLAVTDDYSLLRYEIIMSTSRVSPKDAGGSLVSQVVVSLVPLW